MEKEYYQWIDDLEDATKEYDREVKENARRYDREVWIDDEDEDDEDDE